MHDTFTSFKPDIVINCAAFTNVDKSETEKSLARDVNVRGLENIIKSLPLKSKIIHISTDFYLTSFQSQSSSAISLTFLSKF